MTAAPARRTATRQRAPRVPATMRAAVLDRFGGPEVLTLRVVPVPALDASEVLIAVHTAGVGSWDADMREGWWPDSERPGFPLVLGTDGSRHHCRSGLSRSTVHAGRARVCVQFCQPEGGFYAEYVVVAADKAGRPPRKSQPRGSRRRFPRRVSPRSRDRRCPCM